MTHRQRLDELCAAVRENNQPRVYTLLYFDGVDPTPRAYDVLVAATCRGLAPMLLMLLNWRSLDGKQLDARVSNSTLMHTANNYGRNNIIRILDEWRGANGEKLTVRPLYLSQL